MEKYADADNYRAELLRVMMVQLILRAASYRASSPYSPVAINCDNMGVVKHGSVPAKSLQDKQAQPDIF